jgi:hypothetical protein
MGKAVTDDHFAVRQRRANNFSYQLGTGGGKKKQLCLRRYAHALLCFQNFSDLISQHGTTRFTGQYRRNTTPAELLQEQSGLSALATTLATFKR